jgi:hypothetical protein
MARTHPIKIMFSFVPVHREQFDPGGKINLEQGIVIWLIDTKRLTSPPTSQAHSLENHRLSRQQ